MKDHWQNLETVENQHIFAIINQNLQPIVNQFPLFKVARGHVNQNIDYQHEREEESSLVK